MTCITDSTRRSWRRCGRRSGRLARVAVAIAACAVATWLETASAQERCCGVISVESGRSLVTAYNYESRDIFTFRVTDRAMLSALRPCQGFAATLGGLQAGKTFAVEVDAAPPNKATKANGELVSAPGAAGRVLGMQPHAKFNGVEIVLLELARSDDLITATTLYCNHGSAQVDLAADLRARASNAKLLDLANRTEYQVVRVGGPAGAAMVSDHGAGLKLQPQQSARTWMRFNAPAGEKVSLVVPGAAAPFENLALPKSGGPPTGAEPGADLTAPAAVPGAGGGTTTRPQIAGPSTSRPVGAASPPAGASSAAGGGVPTTAAAGVGGRIMALRQHPRAPEILNAAASKATSPQIAISLLAGEDYLINDCLGVHASAGSFKTRFANPNVRLEGTGIVFTFRIPRISVDALSVRVRPNPANVANPCTFGERFSIGGSIGDIEYEMRYDPILDLTECKLTGPGEFRWRWSIGGLNLKPLQNDLDNAARRMIEMSLNGESFMELPDGLLRPHELVYRYTIDLVNEKLGTNCQPI